MHDARSTVRVGAVSRRLVSALLVALALVTAVAAARPILAVNPFCVGVEEGSLEWYLFLCYLDPPPKDPRT